MYANAKNLSVWSSTVNASQTTKYVVRPVGVSAVRIILIASKKFWMQEKLFNLETLSHFKLNNPLLYPKGL